MCGTGVRRAGAVLGRWRLILGRRRPFQAHRNGGAADDELYQAGFAYFAKLDW